MNHFHIKELFEPGGLINLLFLRTLTKHYTTNEVDVSKILLEICETFQVVEESLRPFIALKERTEGNERDFGNLIFGFDTLGKLFSTNDFEILIEIYQRSTGLKISQLRADQEITFAKHKQIYGHDLVKGRLVMILSGVHYGKVGAFVGWSGTTVKVLFQGEDLPKSLKLSIVFKLLLE